MALSLLQLKTEFHDPMRQGVVDMLRESSSVMPLMNLITHKGLAYPYNKTAKLPGIAFRGLNESYTASTGVINPAVETLTIFGGSIRTDIVAVKLKGEAARTNQIAGQMQAAAKFFDMCFFNGSVGTNVKGFDGLKARLTGKQVIKQADNGATITWEKVIELMDQVEGPSRAKTLFMSQTNRRNLVNDAVTDSKGRLFVEVNASSGEVRFNGAPIVEIFNDETESPILDFTETCGTSNVCSSAYCVRFGDAVDERYVQGIFGLPDKIEHRGPIEASTYLEDVIECVVGIGLFSGHCAARLQGLKAA